MKRQNCGTHLGKLVVVTISLCGLLGIFPHLANAQENRAVAEVPQTVAAQTTPLIGVTNSTKNPNQIAILHWYSSNQTTAVAAGSNPSFVAFDGADIWVTNFNGGDSVTKLQANNGTNLGTFTVGGPATGVAFDGANIWVTNNGSNTVTKLRASDGSTLGTFSVGSAPWGVAYDGANIWVTNSGGGTVTKLLASNGTILGTLAAGTSPSAWPSTVPICGWQMEAATQFRNCRPAYAATKSYDSAIGGGRNRGRATQGPTNYTVSITGTSGAIQHTTQMIVTVQ